MTEILIMRSFEIARNRGLISNEMNKISLCCHHGAASDPNCVPKDCIEIQPYSKKQSSHLAAHLLVKFVPRPVILSVASKTWESNIEWWWAVNKLGKVNEMQDWRQDRGINFWGRYEWGAECHGFLHTQPTLEEPEILHTHSNYGLKSKKNSPFTKEREEI